MYGFALSLLVLLSIETFLSLTGELEDLNTGNYTFLVLVKYVLLTIPRSIHDLFPYALLIGAMLSRKDAFLYLPESVDHFLDRKSVCEKMNNVGFTDVLYTSHTFGTVVIYTGIKP